MIPGIVASVVVSGVPPPPPADPSVFPETIEVWVGIVMVFTVAEFPNADLADAAWH